MSSTPPRQVVIKVRQSKQHVEKEAAGPKGAASKEDDCLLDAVVWNPWVAKAERMGDFGDDE